MRKYICIFRILVGFGYLIAISGLFGQTFRVKNQIVLRDEEDLARVMKDVKGSDTVLMTKALDTNTIEISFQDLRSTKKKVIDCIKTGKEVYAELSSNRKFAVYAYQDLDKKKWISKVYNVETGEVTKLEHNIGDVGNVSVSPHSGAILYEVRKKGVVPKIYVSNGDGSGARLVANGIGPTWSPDGRWFVFIPKGEINFHNTKDNRMAHPKSEPLVIYDSKGNKQIELREFGGIHGEFKWSPNADKLSFVARDRSLSSMGLYIIDLKFMGDKIVGYQNVFVSPDGYYPDWSPDGKYLAFTEIKETEDHNNIANKDVYVVDADGGHAQNITDTPGTWEEKPHWTSDGNLIILKGNELVQLELETE